MNKTNPIKELTDRGFKKIADIAGANKDRITVWVRNGIGLILQQFPEEAGWEIWTPIDRSNSAEATLARLDALMAANEKVAEEPHKLQYEEFWRNIVEQEDGSINADAVMRELHDFGMLIEGASRVYMHATGGRISKPNTDPDAVCSVIDDYVQEVAEEAVSEWKKEGSE